MTSKRDTVFGYMYNIISMLGLLLAAAGAILIIAFMAVQFFSDADNPYLGLMVYFFFPGMLITGLLLVPVGMYRERRRRRDLVEELPPYPRLDFNDPHKRHMFLFFALATIIFAVIVSVASIKGYEFTESTTFCGKLCHTVMQPEHTAWSHSPHARVRCVECHVGPGAEWFVKAKLSGLRQVVAVITGSYSRPIETPVQNLRPARDTCEGCHWPEKFYAGRQKVFYHFAPNEENTAREVNMLIKIGGTPKTPNARGIHWHISSKVHYVARDRERQDIPLVRVTERDGRVTEYVNTAKPLSAEERSHAETRLLDCIDCHNRPTHIYRSPSQEMDEAFVSGHIDTSLPYIKKVAVEILSKPYSTAEEARDAIAREIPAFYSSRYPAVAKQKSAAISQAVTEVQGMYGRNFFPKMKVAWNTYPNNIGHFYYPGCFRCHDGKHTSSDGRTISKDCNLCHTVISQKQENIPEGSPVKGFVHPADIGEALHTMNCSECHTARGI